VHILIYQKQGCYSIKIFFSFRGKKFFPQHDFFKQYVESVWIKCVDMWMNEKKLLIVIHRNDM